MARTKGSKSEITEPRIRSAALGLFATDGVEAVTMRRIGAAAGVRAGALYRYFPDKETLIATLMREYLSARNDRLVAAIQAAEARPGAALDALAGAWVADRIEAEGAAALVGAGLRGLSEPARTEIAEADGAAMTWLEQVLEAGAEAGAFKLPDAGAVALALAAVWDALAGEARLPAERRVRIATSMARRMVRG